MRKPRTAMAAAACLAAGWLGAASLALASPEPASSVAVPNEDEPGWNCAIQGNRMCGPGNSSGLQPGCYNDLGQLVAPWPCLVEVHPDGTADVYDVS